MTQITVYLKLGQSDLGGPNTPAVREITIRVEGEWSYTVGEDGTFEIELDKKASSPDHKSYVFNWAHVLYFDWTEQ